MIDIKLVEIGIIISVGILVSCRAGFSPSEPVHAIPIDDNTVSLTYWSVPVSQNRISDMKSDFGENIFYTYKNMNKIGRLDPETNIISEWTFDVNSTISGISIDLRSGLIYFGYEDMNKIGRLHPGSNIVTEWALKNNSTTDSSGLENLVFDSPSGKLYFTAASTNKIGRLDPQTNMVTEWSLPGNYTDEANATFASYDPSSSDLYIF